MCFLPTDTETEATSCPDRQLHHPLPGAERGRGRAVLPRWHPGGAFQSNQEWYATFTGEDGSRYAVTLEDEDTLALKFYLGERGKLHEPGQHRYLRGGGHG